MRRISHIRLYVKRNLLALEDSVFEVTKHSMQDAGYREDENF